MPWKTGRFSQSMLRRIGKMSCKGKLRQEELKTVQDFKVVLKMYQGLLLWRKTQAREPKPVQDPEEDWKDVTFEKNYWENGLEGFRYLH